MVVVEVITSESALVLKDNVVVVVITLSLVLDGITTFTALKDVALYDEQN